jgi:hypothetical protein
VFHPRGAVHPCSGKKNSLFRVEQGIGCKLLNPLGERLQAAPREAGIRRKIQKFPVIFPVFKQYKQALSY